MIIPMVIPIGKPSIASMFVFAPSHHGATLQAEVAELIARHRGRQAYSAGALASGVDRPWKGPQRE